MVGEKDGIFVGGYGGSRLMYKADAHLCIWAHGPQKKAPGIIMIITSILIIILIIINNDDNININIIINTSMT